MRAGYYQNYRQQKTDRELAAQAERNAATLSADELLAYVLKFGPYHGNSIKIICSTTSGREYLARTATWKAGAPTPSIFEGQAVLRRVVQLGLHTQGPVQAVSRSPLARDHATLAKQAEFGF